MSVRTFALWFGVVGAPLAWAAQLGAGYEAEDAACSAAGARWDFDTGAAEAAVFGITAAVAAASLATAWWSWHAARRHGDARGRVEFMAFSGVLTGALFLVLVLVTGIGVLSLESCVR